MEAITSIQNDFGVGVLGGDSAVSINVQGQGVGCIVGDLTGRFVVRSDELERIFWER